MLTSESVLKWAMRFYPPFLFQSIWTLKIGKDFRSVSVKICKTLFNRNYNNSIFGGTIFSASDPFHVILFHQILTRKGRRVKLWTKHVRIDFIKPADCNLYFTIVLTESDVELALQNLDNNGKFIQTFPVKITDKKGLLYAMAYIDVYIKKIIAK